MKLEKEFAGLALDMGKAAITKLILLTGSVP